MLAGVGMVKMPTFFTRLQAASKASTLGVILMVIGTTLHLPSWELTIKAVLVCLFLLLTTPIATHALALTAKRREYDN